MEERFPDWPGLSILVRGKEKEYGAQLKELGYEYDLCLESLGGKYLTGALDSLAPMGRLLHFGATHSYGGAADGPDVTAEDSALQPPGAAARGRSRPRAAPRRR
mgnify:CR=1 FL=1